MGNSHHTLRARVSNDNRAVVVEEFRDQNWDLLAWDICTEVSPEEVLSEMGYLPGEWSADGTAPLRRIKAVA